mgnify:CR=1 FL=1
MKEESSENEKFNSTYKPGDEVELRIINKTDLGYNALINDADEGLLYHNEIFEPLHPGDIKRGYIKNVREDGKIDLTLQQQGYGHVEEIKYQILEKVKSNKGFLDLGDKSSPEEIHRHLNISKKTFKKAIGALYRDKVIEIKEDGIYLIQE